MQPLLLGRAVSIHPLAVVLAITAGVVLGGIAGGLLAVPFVAVMNTAIRSLLAEDPEELFEELRTDEDGRLYSAEPDVPEPGRFDVGAILAEAQRKLGGKSGGDKPGRTDDTGTRDDATPDD